MELGKPRVYTSHSLMFNGVSGLHGAVIRGDEQLVKELLKRDVNLNVVDGDGRTPLYAAVRQKHFNICQILLDSGADVNLRTSDNGVSPSMMQMAIESKDLSILSLLLNRGLEPNICDRVGRPAILIAAKRPYSNAYTQTLKLLLDYGAKMSLDDFQAVIERGTLETVRLFLDRGMKLSDLKHLNLLHVAVQNPNCKVFEYVLKTNLFNLNNRDEKGRAVIHIAAEKLKVKFMQLLLERGADVNSADKGGLTPLHLLAIRSRRSSSGKNLEKCQELLMKHGADPQAKSFHGGRTPQDIMISLKKPVRVRHSI